MLSVMDGTYALVIVSRVVAIVTAVILLGVSAATCGIIENNGALDDLRKLDGQVIGPVADLLDLVKGSLGVAGQLIATCTFVVLVNIIFLRINTEPSKHLILSVIEIVFNVLVIAAYLATGSLSLEFTSKWGEPPKACSVADSASGEDDVCDSISLTATNAIQSVLCFLHIAILGVGVIIVTLKCRSQ